MEHRPFCCSVKGFVKMLRLDILNSLVAAIFMIIISVLALIPETTKYTVLGGDLINSFITTVFLSVVAILTVQEKERRHLFYVGGSLCLSAAIVCLVDASLVTKMVRQVMKKALGMEGETTPSLAAETAETAAEAAGEEPTQQLIPEPDKMLHPAASETSTVGPSLAKEAATTP
ncbi:CKLF-like MARVEL transmembrane domain-containing protein 1 [Myotis yumanensis]|uniref:CKLF-like MARVEL transmembrane domain-containing protein 1 n=1 Tax=Myotis yumanensis TaxID=159337 RepID=UPI0038D5151E